MRPTRTLDAEHSAVEVSIEKYEKTALTCCNYFFGRVRKGVFSLEC